RIVPYLQPGSGVVITRGDVHYIVTEWGIAYLFGKSIRERVLQLISIAHPDFREDLLKYAKKCNYVYSDQKLPISIEGRLSLYPEKYETIFTLKNGKNIKIRPVKTTDERMLQELYYSLSEHDRYLRFFSVRRDFRHKMVQPLVNIDYSTNMILVGKYSTESPTTAELAFVVHEDWRKNGITKLLLNYMVNIARELNYKYFSGSVLAGNRAMLHIINNAGYPMISKSLDYGVVEFKFEITK
ncbi:MAG: GNAT family N-acetyltransferase, partial [Promethearchaeota archaeon]